MTKLPASTGETAGVAALMAESGLPRHEAERLLIRASGLDRAALAAADGIGSKGTADFRKLVARRLSGEPLQYLEESTQFGPLDLLSDSRALVPRPETEQLWELAVEWVRADPPQIIVDLCTGSGNLALAMKHHFAAADVYGTDTSRDALELAQENASRTGLVVQWCEGDLFAALPSALSGRVDLLVANPPYLADGEAEDLPVDVRDHEPPGALFAGPRGDEVLERIAAKASRWLRPGGVIACEISEFRAPRAEEMFRQYAARVVVDLTGRPRFVIGRLPAG